jgi:hypothetical protein
MRKRFRGFNSAVDLADIDIVMVRAMTNPSEGAEVVITTKGGNEIIRTFIPRPNDPVHQRQMLNDADACVRHVEFVRRWGVRLERIGPHFLTFLSSAAFTGWLTGHWGKVWAWIGL